MNVSGNGEAVGIKNSYGQWEIKDLILDAKTAAEQHGPLIIEPGWEPYACQRDRRTIVVALRRRRPIEEQPST